MIVGVVELFAVGIVMVMALVAVKRVDLEDVDAAPITPSGCSAHHALEPQNHTSPPPVLFFPSHLVDARDGVGGLGHGDGRANLGRPAAVHDAVVLSGLGEVGIV